MPLAWCAISATMTAACWCCKRSLTCLLTLLCVPLCCCCSLEWGGSNIRPEATGYGAVYFGENILRDQGDDFKVRGVRVQGFGWSAGVWREIVADELAATATSVVMLCAADTQMPCLLAHALAALTA